MNTVAKHGNRSVSSKSGAADVLEKLGAKITITAEQNEKVLNDCGFVYMFAPGYHSSMKYAAPVRKEIGIRTVFNVLGPLTNPAFATMQLMGVYEDALVKPMAQVLKNLGIKSGMVVCGDPQETCDIYAKAVGVNGNRAMVVDLDSTDPDGWDKDKHITYDSPTDTVVWEVHVRDFSISPDSGVTDANKGKYLAFTEKGTTLNSQGVISTGIDYLKELGVTHVQLLPVFDYATIDETQDGAFNWGYDPKNYNVPEGSYSSDPYDGNVRINEFKQMIKALHDAGIGVIMDVVYNHTYTAKDSSFQKTVPNYYYRMNKDGTFSDASGCGNETASEHAMFRKYMIDSILYWIQEYHIDGFRFDLMGVHDVTTMNKIREAVDKLDGGKKIILYGEPWTLTKETTALLYWAFLSKASSRKRIGQPSWQASWDSLLKNKKYPFFLIRFSF